MPSPKSDSILAGLNPEQKAAVTATEGPVMVLAGAGSGKTRVITHRIAWLVANGAAPERILAVTFTNKAANEMKERVSALLPANTQQPFVSTFHSFGLWLIRQARKWLGPASSSLVIDESDRNSLIRQVRQEMNLTDKDVSEDEVFEILMRVKGCGDSFDDACRDLGPRKKGLLRSLYDNYSARLQLARSLDFDDLILKPVNLLEGEPEALAYFADMFDYVMVDEYQDTNFLQSRLLSLLVSTHRNVCVVGDDDQSIYGWRGARIENILDFDRHFEGCQVIKLTRNYRCETNILDLANAVISRNVARHDKSLWTKNSNPVPVVRYQFETQRQEAAEVADQVHFLVAGGMPPNQVAVLYRTRQQSKYLQETFRLMGIPYRVVGSFDFFERKEVRDVLAYLRLAVNPHDEIAFRRVVNYPSRGIGLTTLARLEVLRRKGLPYPQAARKLLDDSDATITVRTRRALSDFLFLLEKWHLSQAEARQHDLVSLYRSIADESGIVQDLSVRSPNSLKTITALLNLLESGLSQHTFSTLEQFLERVTLQQREADFSPGDVSQGGVTLMTIHSAKGLEFPAVFLVGLVEGLFPHFRSAGDRAGTEEERRLFYVAVTRARRHLTLSLFNQKEERGESRECKPSRFLTELPDSLVERRTGPKATAITRETAREQFEAFEREFLGKG